MNFVVSVLHCVDDLPATVTFLCEVLGFQQQSATANVAVVENGAVVIRLLSQPNGISDNLTLELSSQDKAQTLAQLLNDPRIQILQQTTAFSRQDRQETLLQAPHGIKILVAQEFNEDQLGIMPPLPTALIWDDDAEACVKKLLQIVPISFRAAARTRVTERAEMLAGETGSVTVNLATALSGMALATPLFQHPALIEALHAEGINPSAYFQELGN